MSETTIQARRRQVWAAAKAAVHAYSRDPCEANAQNVRLACAQLRALPVAEPSSAAKGAHGSAPARQASEASPAMFHD